MDFDFSLWWESLSTILKVYWTIAIPSTLLLLFQVIMTFVGGEIDTDGHVDVDIDSDHGIGFQFFSFKNFVGFFAMFSWVGIGLIDSGFSTFLSVILALIAGLLMMTAMAAIFYYFSKLSDSGTLSISNALYGTGEVYLPIKAKRQNVGKVSIKVQGGLRELDAVTDDEEDLPTGSTITVIEVTETDLLIVTKSL